MDNIKLYINATIEDVKNYIEKLIDLIKEKYPKFNEIYLKMITGNSQVSYWNLISDKLNFFSNIIFNKNKDKNKNNSFFTTILFLLFGNKNNYNKLIHISINIEEYKNSSYSNEIINFRNCIIILLIQEFIINEKTEKNIIKNDYKNNLINNINRIIKSSYIKKSIHVIKSLLKKNINNENDIFILLLFYFIYKDYQKLFIDFLNSENCDIKKEYKNILIKEFEIFKYDEKGVINYSNKIFEIKLSYSLLGLNPKNEKTNKFLETIKDKKLKAELLEVFQNYYYKQYFNNNNSEDDKTDNKKDILLNILKEVQSIKKNIKEVKNNIEEMKLIQDNYIDDIIRILNIINKQ